MQPEALKLNGLGRRLDEKIFDDLSVDQIFLNDPLKVFGSAGVIPGSFRVDYRDGALGADTEAICFRPMNQGLRAAEIELLEAVLEKLPGGHAFIGGAALGLGGSSAEENMAFIFSEVEGLGGGGKKVGHDRAAIRPLYSRWGGGLFLR